MAAPSYIALRLVLGMLDTVPLIALDADLWFAIVADQRLLRREYPGSSTSIHFPRGDAVGHVMMN